MDEAWKPELVAHRSTRGDGVFAKKRWTELAIWYLHNHPRGKHWAVVTAGHSSVEGERVFTTTTIAASLDEALAYLNDSQPARAVAKIAHAWLDENAQRLDAASAEREIARG